MSRRFFLLSSLGNSIALGTKKKKKKKKTGSEDFGFGSAINIPDLLLTNTCWAISMADSC
jgi:hypothetical protein